MPLYYNDELSLEQYTTTIDDVEKKVKKKHPTEPLYLDAESLKVSPLYIPAIITNQSRIQTHLQKLKQYRRYRLVLRV